MQVIILAFFFNSNLNMTNNKTQTSWWKLQDLYLGTTDLSSLFPSWLCMDNYCILLQPAPKPHVELAQNASLESISYNHV